MLASASLASTACEPDSAPSRAHGTRARDASGAANSGTGEASTTDAASAPEGSAAAWPAPPDDAEEIVAAALPHVTVLTTGRGGRSDTGDEGDVARVRVAPELAAELVRDDASCAALAHAPQRELQLAVVEVLGGDVLETPPMPPWSALQKRIFFALMANEDAAVAAAATQAATRGARALDGADPDIGARLAELCRSDARASVRAQACPGIVLFEHTRFADNPDAQAVVAGALGDGSSYVVMRTLEELGFESLDARYQDRVVPLLTHPEPALRGLAATVVWRSVGTGKKTDPSALERAHDALVPLVEDPDPFVRCAAVSALGSYALRASWDFVDAVVAHFDDRAEPVTTFAYDAPTLAGAKPARATLRGMSPTVAACAIRAMLLKARHGEPTLSFDAWPDLATKGADTFRVWWKPLRDRFKRRK